MDEKKEMEYSGPGLWTNFTETTGFHGLNKMTFDKTYPGRVVRRYQLFNYLFNLFWYKF